MVADLGAVILASLALVPLEIFVARRVMAQRPPRAIVSAFKRIAVVNTVVALALALAIGHQAWMLFISSPILSTPALWSMVAEVTKRRRQS